MNRIPKIAVQVSMVTGLLTSAWVGVKADDIVDTAAKAGSFKTLVAAVKAAGLVSTLKGDGPFTVFAPTDEAFAKLPQETLKNLLKPENRDKLRAILTYHVLPNETLATTVIRLKNNATLPTVNGARLTVRRRNGVKINDANLIQTDILTDNGVIHAIDTVLIPPVNGNDERSEPESPRKTNIIATAENAGNFTTLIAAVKAAGLTHTLKERGSFTVFAPTDEAFAKIPRETLQALLKPENRDKLRAILTYHVLPGKVAAADAFRLPNDTRVATVNGAKLRIRNQRNRLHIDNSRVLKADIEATNGVIHVIDTVLMPPMETDDCDK